MRSLGKGNLLQEQQLITTVKDLRVYEPAFLDIKICVVCICVQNDKTSPFANNSCTNLETRHFSGFQNFGEILAYHKLAFLDIKECQKVTKNMHRLISNNIKKYQIKQFLTSEYAVAIEARGIQW